MRWLACTRCAPVALAVAIACGPGEGGGPPPPEVGVATARVGAVPDRREYVGNVTAVVEVELRARVRGYLTEVLFQDGQRVASGDVLFRIDPDPFRVALAEAKGMLSAAAAEAQRAELEFERARELSAGDVVSQSLLDQRRAEHDGARARVESARAAVRAAELDLSWCTVTAPIAGRIGRRLVDVGNLVGASGEDTVLARIVQVDPIHVYFAPTELERLEVLRGAREGRLPQQREGLPVAIELGDGTPYPHPGTIDYIDPIIEPTRGTVTVRAVVPNPDDVLKPGEFVRAYVVFPDVADAVLVPERAVLEEQGGSYVLAVSDDGTVQQKSVVAGVVHDGMQRIVEGLAAGERVVVDGVMKARPGQKVVPVALEAAAPPKSEDPAQPGAGHDAAAQDVAPRSEAQPEGDAPDGDAPDGAAPEP
jgi:RND family efflux transporter MFP subunit